MPSCTTSSLAWSMERRSENGGRDCGRRARPELPKDRLKPVLQKTPYSLLSSAILFSTTAENRWILSGS